MRPLHRRLAALLALIALCAFISGAGLDALSVLPAGAVLFAALFVRPSPAAARVLEPIWRALALILAARAGFVVLSGGVDPVIPMVDLLMLLLCAESLRERDGSGDARHFALTFALLIAAAAYRPGPLFAPLFAAYVVCATVLLALGHLARQAERHGRSDVRVERSFLLRLAALSSAVLFTSAAVFLFFPRVSQGWASRPASPVARSVVGFADHVSLGAHGARIEPNPEIVLRVEFPEGPPAEVERLHWRGRSYNHFDGVTWSRSGSVEMPPLEVRWPGGTIEQVVFARPVSDANVVFGLHPIVSVTPQSRIRTMRGPSGDYSYGGRGEPIYRVQSRRSAPAPETLRNAPVRYPVEMLPWLQLPPLSSRMAALADSFRVAHRNPYDIAVALERWLQSATFTYTLDLPATRREATLDHFLFVRRAGHCEYFSTAMAVLLRAAGVPARNVNGFLGGAWNPFGRFLTVTQNNAHSWVEVFFPGQGWVTFDPTPAAAADEIGSAYGTGRSFGRFFDGIGHRWSKWILDYDVGTQLSLLDRFAAPFSEAPAEQQQRSRWWLVAAAVLVPLALYRAAQLLRSPGAAPPHRAARHYIRLRRAYARAGYASLRSTPLALAAAVEGAPGHEAARSLVDTYLHVRFGGRELHADEERRMQRQVEEVRSALRAARSVRERIRR